MVIRHSPGLFQLLDRRHLNSQLTTDAGVPYAPLPDHPTNAFWVKLPT